MNDPRYSQGVNGLTPEQLAESLRASITAVQAFFPLKTGVIVFAFDFEPNETGEKGFGYIANAERDSAVQALKEWMRNLDSRN